MNICRGNLPEYGIGREGSEMRKTVWRGLAALLACAMLTACGPLLFGGGAAVMADQVAEDEKGGDGLF